LNIIYKLFPLFLPLFVLELLGAPFLYSRYSLDHPHPAAPFLPEIRATTSVKGATSYKLKPSPFCQLLGKPLVLRRSFRPQPKNLTTWEDNQGFFVEDTGICDNLNIPKFHSLLYYIKSICLFGATDNYNSEMFEQLHIDFAKHDWQASNKHDEFPQMISWLSHQEKIDLFNSYLSGSELSGLESGQPLHGLSQILVAKFPNYPNKSIENIIKSHQSPAFKSHLKEYLNHFLDKHTSNQ